MKEVTRVNNIEVWNYVTVNDMPVEFWDKFTENAMTEFNGSYAKQIQFDYQFRTGIINILNNLAKQVDELQQQIIELKNDSFIKEETVTVIKEQNNDSCFFRG